MYSSPVFNLIYRSLLSKVSLSATISCCILLSHSQLVKAQQENSPSLSQADTEGEVLPQEDTPETVSNEATDVKAQGKESEGESLPQLEIIDELRASTTEEAVGVTLAQAERGSIEGTDADLEIDWQAQEPAKEGSLAIPTLGDGRHPLPVSNHREGAEDAQRLTDEVEGEQAILPPEQLAVDWSTENEGVETSFTVISPREQLSNHSTSPEIMAPLPASPAVSSTVANNSNSYSPNAIANSGSGSPTGAPVQWSAYNAVPSNSSQTTAPGPVPTPTGGTWVMVWLPYGAPGTTMTAPGGPAPTMPTGIPTQGYYPAWIPQEIPGMVTNVPAPAMGGIPWEATGSGANAGRPNVPPQMTGGAYPGGLPVVFIPQTYPAAPQINSPAVPSSPSGQAYLPYNGPVAPTVSPLQVPAAPNVTGTIPELPSPPPVTIPAIPINPYPGLSQPDLNPDLSQSIPTTPSPGNFSVPVPVESTQPINPAATTANNLGFEEPLGPVTEPNLDLQGLYILQGDNSSARARVSGSAFLTRYLMVGGALDVVTGPDLTNDDGIQLTELYLAAALPDLPALRFRFGQLDLTSYFDRNSFAKDASRDFFNSTFQTNPALIAGANVTASRPAGLVQWNITDDIALSSAVFSSDADIGDFALNGFAVEASFRTGDLIVRGTFISSEDSEFQGTGDRLESYGLNAEWFIPDMNIGLFGRYGKLNNAENDFDADTYSIGMNAFDVFMDDDRLGLAYGRNLETDFDDDTNPDVLEVFYDFELLPNIRTGFSLQQRNSFTETFAGFRIRADIDLTPSVLAD